MPLYLPQPGGVMLAVEPLEPVNEPGTYRVRASHAFRGTVALVVTGDIIDGQHREPVEVHDRDCDCQGCCIPITPSV